MDQPQNSEVRRVDQEGGDQRFSLSTIAASLLWMFLSGAMVLLFGFATRNTVALITNGIETVGEVISSNPHICGSRKRRHTCYEHTLDTATLGAIDLDLDREYAIGTQILVTFEPSNRENLHAGTKPKFSKLDWLQYGAMTMLAASCLSFGLGWHGAVYGLGVRRISIKILGYCFFLAIVIWVYFWIAIQFTNMSKMQIAETVFTLIKTAVISNP